MKFLALIINRLGLKSFIQRLEWEVSREEREIVRRIFKEDDRSDSSLARIGLHETVFDKTSASKAENARNNFKSKLVLFRRTFNAAVKLRVARLKGVK